LKQQPPHHESPGSSLTKGMNQASYGLSVAFAFVAVVMGLWLLGRWVDGVLHTEPWAQVVGAIVGWIGGVAVVYVAAQRGLE